MDELEKKFLKLGVENAPGQEIQKDMNEKVEKNKELIDFSHGDVDAFNPIPGSLDKFIEGVHIGGEQAYTEYKGKEFIRNNIASKLSYFTESKVDEKNEIIITPGTQGALFLAMGSLIAKGDKVCIIEPDYFANRKIAEFFDGEVIPVKLNYLNSESDAGVDLNQLEQAFKSGVKLFLFSNPNNPTGVIYSADEIKNIAELAQKYNVTIIVDQLYSRQVFEDNVYTHLCAQEKMNPENIVTIMGPSKTESLSGYRLGVAFGSSTIIKRMEKLQAIVSLRAGGYNQAVLSLWFSEPKGWLENRVKQHQLIRDDLILRLEENKNIFKVRSTEAGSYLFPQIINLQKSIEEFVDILRSQENIIVTPGTEFGKQFTNSFRMNFSQDHKKALDAVDRIIKKAKEYT